MTLWDGAPLAYALGEGPDPARHPAPTAATNKTRHADFLAALAKLPR
jgi:hypothetical protein